jgi:hypothetical protein
MKCTPLKSWSEEAWVSFIYTSDLCNIEGLPNLHIGGLLEGWPGINRFLSFGGVCVGSEGVASQFQEKRRHREQLSREESREKT